MSDAFLDPRFNQPRDHLIAHLIARSGRGPAGRWMLGLMAWTGLKSFAAQEIDRSCMTGLLPAGESVRACGDADQCLVAAAVAGM